MGFLLFNLTDRAIRRYCCWYDCNVKCLRSGVRIQIYFGVIYSMCYTNFMYVCVRICRPISGASMNPARSLGPAFVKHEFKGLWIYVIGPVAGAIAGASAYSLVRAGDRPSETLSFLTGSSK